MSKKKINFYDRFGLKCTPTCIYFPNITCQEGEYEYDNKMHCNVRKDNKNFLCLYDNKPIDWKRDCPRKEVE